MHRIPVAAPSLDGNEERYVVDAVELVDRIHWQLCRPLRARIASMCGTRAAVSAVKRTAALHLALVALV